MPRVIGITYLPTTISDPNRVFGRSAHLAAHRAKIRHQISSDGTHRNGRSLGELHPNATAFLRNASRDGTNAHQDLLEQTHQDALDALTALDRLDGGLMLCIRCPGAIPAKPDFTRNDITLRCYLPPRELGTDVQGFEGHIGYILQYFVENLAHDHLRCLQERSLMSRVSALESRPATADPLFPFPTARGTSSFNYSGGAWIKSESDDSEDSEDLGTRDEPITTAPASQHTTVQAATDAPDPNFVEYPTLQSERAHHGAIISIGPKTDCILDLLELGDQIIPHLRHLIRTTRSGNWVIELQKKEWGLTGRRDAQMISEALLADVKALELARPRSLSIRVVVIGLILLLIGPGLLLYAA